MKKCEADEILAYVAQHIISPLSNDNRPAKEVWLEMIGDPFNNLCQMIYEKVEKTS